MRSLARGALPAVVTVSVSMSLWALAAMTLAAACTAGAVPATAPRVVRVASKTFTESVILGEMVTQMARSAGVPAQHQSGFGGTRLVWDALVSGAIDIYPEYTGTLFEEILVAKGEAADRSGAAGSRDAEGLRRRLAARGIGMSAPLGFNNSYALGVTEARARQLGLNRISDLRAHPELHLGFSNEFISRRDGWPALRARYDLPQTQVTGLDHDLAYRGLARGAIDATDLYATDPEVRRYGLRVLEDDRQEFARYDAVLLYRLDRFDWAEKGGAVAAMRRLEGRIDGPTMAGLNARAKLDHVSEADVAASFLRATFGVVAAASASRGMAATIWGHAVEHLVLVSWSLLAAILLGVPLGIVAARRPRLGQAVLGAVGLLQTIPSLALLVFMIPLLGIGAPPAMTALFLYSLLPIVRNTHAGLRGISPALRESAEALGLTSGAVLRLVELPLASPFILAGIKSAAVVNVGAATLGALVGAGGFGQPIFTGIRLDDVGLILQGAIPASLLALAVQGLFEIVERLVVSRGLRS
jgi:osmoprotectant transport system permease protein